MINYEHKDIKVTKQHYKLTIQISKQLKNNKIQYIHVIKCYINYVLLPLFPVSGF